MWSWPAPRRALLQEECDTRVRPPEGIVVMRIEVSAVGTDDVVSFRCSAGAGAGVWKSAEPPVAGRVYDVEVDVDDDVRPVSAPRRQPRGRRRGRQRRREPGQQSTRAFETEPKK